MASFGHRDSFSAASLQRASQYLRAEARQLALSMVMDMCAYEAMGVVVVDALSMLPAPVASALSTPPLLLLVLPELQASGASDRSQLRQSRSSVTPAVTMEGASVLLETTSAVVSRVNAGSASGRAHRLGISLRGIVSTNGMLASHFVMMDGGDLVCSVVPVLQDHLEELQRHGSVAVARGYGSAVRVTAGPEHTLRWAATMSGDTCWPWKDSPGTATLDDLYACQVAANSWSVVPAVLGQALAASRERSAQDREEELALAVHPAAAASTPGSVGPGSASGRRPEMDAASPAHGQQRAPSLSWTRRAVRVGSDRSDPREEGGVESSSASDAEDVAEEDASREEDLLSSDSDSDSEDSVDTSSKASEAGEKDQIREEPQILLLDAEAGGPAAEEASHFETESSDSSSGSEDGCMNQDLERDTQQRVEEGDEEENKDDEDEDDDEEEERGEDEDDDDEEEEDDDDDDDDDEAEEEEEDDDEEDDEDEDDEDDEDDGGAEEGLLRIGTDGVEIRVEDEDEDDEDGAGGFALHVQAAEGSSGNVELSAQEEGRSEADSEEQGGDDGEDGASESEELEEDEEEGEQDEQDDGNDSEVGEPADVACDGDGGTHVSDDQGEVAAMPAQAKVVTTRPTSVASSCMSSHVEIGETLAVLSAHMDALLTNLETETTKMIATLTELRAQNHGVGSEDLAAQDMLVASMMAGLRNTARISLELRAVQTSMRQGRRDVSSLLRTWRAAMSYRASPHQQQQEQHAAATFASTEEGGCVAESVVRLFNETASQRSDPKQPAGAVGFGKGQRRRARRARRSRRRLPYSQEAIAQLGGGHAAEF